MAQTKVHLPAKLGMLFEPARYKVLHGGRGSGKSWGVARALLTLAAKRPMRILCAREVQKSITDSVHRLLSDQIEKLGLGAFYEVLQSEIRGRNGSQFLFAGIRQQSIGNLKSFEGVDICWVEEAQVVTKASWNVLIPTIRAPASEIWITFNPDLDTDETYQRFVKSPPSDSRVVKVNWNDNPWFPAELARERDSLLARDPTSWRNVWQGECRPAVDGAIYATEVASAQDAGRVREVPPDPVLKTHAVFDLGWNDAMSIALVQRSGSEVRVVGYIEDSHRTLADYSADMLALRHNWGKVWLPHDARAKNIQTGRSAEETMRALGWDVQIIGLEDVESGIRNARLVFPRIYFDAGATSRLMECLKRYRRSINHATNEPGAPLHDEFSHGADCFRYLCAVADQLGNEDWGGKMNYPRFFSA